MAYCKSEILGWNAYVNFLSAKGKRFVLTEQTRKEVSERPPMFHVFTYSDPQLKYRNIPTKLEYFAEKASQYLFETFNVTEAELSPVLTKYCSGFSNVDLVWHSVVIFLRTCISADKVYAITENLINRFIREKEDRVKVEIIWRRFNWFATPMIVSHFVL